MAVKLNSFTNLLGNLIMAAVLQPLAAIKNKQYNKFLGGIKEKNVLTTGGRLDILQRA